MSDIVNERYNEHSLTLDSSFSTAFEEPWTIKLEEILREWESQCDLLSKKHDEAAMIYKSRFHRLAIPTVLIPFSMGFVSQLFEQCSYESQIINGLMFTISGILSGISTLFKFDSRYEQHKNHSDKYQSIVIRIQSELARKKNFRVPADAFITEIKITMSNLNESAPDLPCFKRV